jgi:hypothetical protein
VPVTAPAKLRTPAITSAARIERARVATTSAIALAASFNPLVKPNPRARTILATKRYGDTSGILESYPFKYIGYILTSVGGALHMLIYFSPFDEFNGIGNIIKKLSHSRM